MARLTGGRSRPIDPDGELYQRRALQALPILVRQALAAQPIYYSEIARELDMPLARNMNYVLGSIGNSLRVLGTSWGEDLPPLQALAINKATGMPGEGFAEFVTDPVAFRKAPRHVRRQIVQGLLTGIYSYPNWLAVLNHFNAPLPASPPPELLRAVGGPSYLGGEAESEAHRAFKIFIANNPTVLGLKRVRETVIEHCFPSGDEVDIRFETAQEVIVVEVKSRISGEKDILRGIFQCVKYQALIDAELIVARRRIDAQTMLVLEGSLPATLRGVANALGVAVIESIRRQEGPD